MGLGFRLGLKSGPFQLFNQIEMASYPAKNLDLVELLIRKSDLVQNQDGLNLLAFRQIGVQETDLALI